jgi:catechol 2,3-dioxygenase-like lactoylglutathione lyase family enzyme
MSATQPVNARFGVHSIDHFALQVPDLQQARHFLDAFGLCLTEREHGIDVRTANDPHCWARIDAGPRKRLVYLSFNCYEADLAGLRSQVVDAGAKILPSAEQPGPQGFWLYDPDGNLLQVKTGPKTTPVVKSVLETIQVPPGMRGAPGRAQRPRAAPTRLSHVFMFTADLDRALDFYLRALGLKLSDRSGGLVAFTHGRHGSDHHLVAFVQDAKKGWHHSAWDVPGIDHIGWGSEQMRDAGYREGWGLAQHTLGANYFYYVRDPWGSFWEYSAHMDYIPAGVAWHSGDYLPEDALYLWGPEMPAYFIENTES